MKRILGLVAALTVVALGTNLYASFTPGNIVVCRVGDGSHSLTNIGNTVFLDEYTTNSLWAAAGTFSPPVPVQSIAMPTNWFGRNGPLRMSGTALGDGALSRSSDGRFILLAGYGATPGQVTNQSLDSTTTTGLVDQVARVVGLVDGFGHVYTTTTLIDANEDGNAVQSAVSIDGTNIWHVGEGNATGGKYTTQGSMISTQVETLSRFNNRFFNIFNKTLYYSANHVLGGATITNVTVNPIGTTNLPALLPTSFVTSNFFFLAGVMGSTITNSPAIGSPWSFCMFNLNGGAAPDTLYVADNTTNAPGEPVGKAGGVLKYSFIPASNAWVNFGYIYAEGATGVTGVKNGTNVDLYITEGGTVTPINQLYPYHDVSGFAGDPASNPWGPDANLNSEPLAPPSVPNALLINTRGIAFAPQGGDSGTISGGAGVISVGPPFGPYYRGPQGGPFSSNNYAFTVANLGGQSTNFTVTFIPPTVNWFTATPSSGTLASGASTTVILTPNANANAKGGGFAYTGHVVFHAGLAGGIAMADRLATLVVDAFFITPSSNYVAVGSVGGAFTPSSFVYTLTNVTPGALAWTASTSASWNSLSATNGTLPGNTATNITVSITANANSLARGTYQDILTITNVVAHAPLPTRNITLQVGFGFFDDFSVGYANGNIVGQNNWYNPTSGLNDNPYQIVNGVLVIPAGSLACDTSNDEEPAKDIASTVVTDATQFAYLGMSITVTSAPATPATWDFTLLPTAPGGNVTHNESRTAVNDVGGGNYVWNNHVNGFDSFYHGTTPRAYGTKYNVIIVGDIVNSNSWVFVNPSSGDTNDLFAMAYDAHDGPDVAGTTGWSGPGDNGVGGIDIDNFCRTDGDQAGFLIYKIALSTNYTDVYNFLTQVTPPTASFTASPTNGAAPLGVSFTDTSTGTPTSWNWAFGDSHTSTAQNPANTYLNPGAYTAQLIASNAGGSSTNTVTIGVYERFAWWRLFYFGNTNSANGAPSADADGTGTSNTNKFLAGFNPTNSAAYLHVISIAKTNSTDINVIYLGASGDNTWLPGIQSRTNVLEVTTGTANGSYASNNFASAGVTNILSGGTGLGTVTNVVEVGGATNKPSRFYRVRVLLP